MWNWDVVEFVVSAVLLIYLVKSPKSLGYYFKFTYFYLLLTFLGILLLPVLVVQYLMSRQYDNLLIFSKILCKLSEFFLGISWEIRGGDNLKSTKSSIIVANHQTSLDCIGLSHLTLLSKRVYVIGKRELLFSGPFGIAMFLSGLKFINRRNGRKSIDTLNSLAEDLKKNESKMWVFPEGTRRNSGKINEFKKGAFAAAIKSQLPINPVVYSSYKNFLDSENKTFTDGQIVITVLPQIKTVGMTDDDVDTLMENTRRAMIAVFSESLI